MRIEQRYGREYLVRSPCYGETCGAEADGFRCVLERNHENDEHIATGFWERAGSEIFKRWPVGSAEGDR